MKYEVIKNILADTGARLPASWMHLLNGVYNYLNIGFWFHQRGFEVRDRFVSRKELYEHLATLIEGPVSYVEFGVFRGASMRIWSSLLKDPGSTLDGFDSFEGLPEVWRMAADEATFDVKGVLPDIDDPRITFHKGWFSETVPGFLREFQPRPQLVLHLDADLYSSTCYVMEELVSYMKPGTLLVFDELFDRDHELRALDEFLAKHPMRLECVGATRGLTQAAFRILPGE